MNIDIGDNYRETIYPLCLICGLRCHGCSVCGFIFTCSKCEPCHEGNNPELTRCRGLDSWLWSDVEGGRA